MITATPQWDSEVQGAQNIILLATAFFFSPQFSKILNTLCSFNSYTFFWFFNIYVLPSISDQFLFYHIFISLVFHFTKLELPHNQIPLHALTLDAELCHECFQSSTFHLKTRIQVLKYFSALHGYVMKLFYIIILHCNLLHRWLVQWELFVDFVFS